MWLEQNIAVERKNYSILILHRLLCLPLECKVIYEFDFNTDIHLHKFIPTMKWIIPLNLIVMSFYDIANCGNTFWVNAYTNILHLVESA